MWLEGTDRYLVCQSRGYLPKQLQVLSSPKAPCQLPRVLFQGFYRNQVQLHGHGPGTGDMETDQPPGRSFYHWDYSAVDHADCQNSSREGVLVAYGSIQ